MYYNTTQYMYYNTIHGNTRNQNSKSNSGQTEHWFVFWIDRREYVFEKDLCFEKLYMIGLSFE